MSNYDNLPKEINDRLLTETSNINKYSLIGNRINIHDFMIKFQFGAKNSAGKEGTVGAHYTRLSAPFCFPNLFDVVTRINQDLFITDIRWAAYMLATTYWETARAVDTGIRRKHGNTNYKAIETFVPVEESGHGGSREYSYPVFTLRAPSGDGIVIDRYKNIYDVRKSGLYKKTTAKALGLDNSILDSLSGQKKMSTPRLLPTIPQHIFYGRGYVQLTWWHNYVAAGIALGKGLDFLFDPDLVMQPDNAYKIMSIGMREGKIFANTHKLIHFFNAGSTDYLNARRMVNGKDNAQNIASIAKSIENLLLESVGT